ncbi:MAG: SpoIVB peptidase [Firmicutes bacterium]|nr:SpoIVB peptidase [Bacillota bacterium]
MLIVTAVYVVQIYNIISFPSQMDIFRGENETIDILFPFTVKLHDNNNKREVLKFIEDREEDESLKVSVRNSYKFKSIENGEAKLEFKLLGLIPIKNVNINVVDNLYLVPGGNTIGVKLETKGVLVVALSDDLVGVDGKKHSPSIDAGIKVGDVITKINDTNVKDASHVIRLLNEVGESKVKITLERNEYEFTTEVQPVKCSQDNSYRLGLWVRDKTAGIGTLTFYHPESRTFGALGHGITDVDTGSLMPISNGEILKATISSIEQGKKGEPGELRGAFFETSGSIGKIFDNSPFGIYGTLGRNYDKIPSNKAIPIGLQNEVKTGKAYILSTIENDKIEKFEIEILKAQPQSSPTQKSMVIQVTDKKLLEKTGGIVQGMSGSPIIQDGKLIGAVTHVFVNDPTKGYGIYINWMIKEAGISLDKKTLPKAN